MLEVNPPRFPTLWEWLLCLIKGHDPHLLGRSTIVICRRCGAASRMVDE